MEKYKKQLKQGHKELEEAELTLFALLNASSGNLFTEAKNVGRNSKKTVLSKDSSTIDDGSSGEMISGNKPTIKEKRLFQDIISANSSEAEEEIKPQKRNHPSEIQLGIPARTQEENISEGKMEFKEETAINEDKNHTPKDNPHEIIGNESDEERQKELDEKRASPDALISVTEEMNRELEEKKSSRESSPDITSEETENAEKTASSGVIISEVEDDFEEKKSSREENPPSLIEPMIEVERGIYRNCCLMN